MAGGRPMKLTKTQREEVLKALEDYLANEDDPTLVGFCALDETAVRLDVTEDNLQDWTEFSNLRKRSVKKQEAYLLRQGTRNRINTTMAIFRLKQPQHGYTDKSLVENSGEQKLIVETRRYGSNKG